MAESLVGLGVDDVPAMLVLNEANVPAVGSVNELRMRGLVDMASLAIGMKDDGGGLLAFVLTMGPGAGYDSLNYRFFDNRFDDFVYVDRVVVAECARSARRGTQLYDEVVARSADVRLMTAEVNEVPPNEGSMRFHERRGFRQVGAMENEDATKRVVFLAVALDDEVVLDLDDQ